MKMPSSIYDMNERKPGENNSLKRVKMVYYGQVLVQRENGVGSRKNFYVS